MSRSVSILCSYLQILPIYDHGKYSGKLLDRKYLKVLAKRATCPTFRHSFPMRLLESGYGIRTVQELFRHKDVKTTMIYTHGLNRGGRGMRSPASTALS
ncbi:MAG: tyrosine-type recombinase/integrase [Deltaproteobacteria bacterium]|nr:tyrosine-type recombinase/integrase [Deltaproteobacteria bacterium]